MNSTNHQSTIHEALDKIETEVRYLRHQGDTGAKKRDKKSIELAIREVIHQLFQIDDDAVTQASEQIERYASERADRKKRPADNLTKSLTR